MELGSVKHFLKGKTILVTGATVFVEKVLRVQPDVKKLYLLLRASNPCSATERMQNEIIGKDLFRVLRDELGDDVGSFISEKVIAVAGDVSLENLGIKYANLRKDMLEEIDIVLHSAASTKFDERFDVAMRINTIGAFHVLNFAKNCTKVVILLHVSTAYMGRESEGLISEEPFQVGETLNGFSKLDMDFEKKLVEKKLHELRAQNSKEETITSEMRSFGLDEEDLVLIMLHTCVAKKHGWPNTYAFTKAMAEMLVEHKKENLPVVILRPTIVTSTYKEPFPGWVEGVRTVDSCAIAYCKRKLSCLPGNIKAAIDVIPADMVVNALIVAMVASASKCYNNIYHVGSSMRNPLKYINILDYFYKYFTKVPWMDKNGKPIKVGTITMLDMAGFKRYIFIHYLLPLKGFKLLNTVCCQHFQKRCLDFNRKIQVAMRLVNLYRPYLFFNGGVFDDRNMEKVEMAAKQGGVEMDLFYFDPKMIDWEDYFMNVHFPGMVKCLIK
ncbi:hypothetical protein L6164_026464 [Bauhinia variegata]|uniref:Uncharacterized protein n=1 Tax=Bauhinia variegata TaxID=167791 RepID=A0ACB9LQ90_BAUVA|nr:hypothetical protein L6164_026464 [Bauhinia variegata]